MKTASRRSSSDPASILPQPDRFQFAWVCGTVGAFFFLALVKVLHHAMWRDEVQAWLIVRASASLADVYHHTRYEGHPALWYLCLYLLTRLTSNLLVMQLFHLAVATAVVWLVARFAPFTRWQKALFAFGYFPFFEYGTITRNYSPGLLFIFAFCALHSQPRRNYLALAVALFLAAQSNAGALTVGGALALGCIADELLAIRSGQKSSLSNGQALRAALILGGGLLCAVLFMRPAPDVGTKSPLASGYRAAYVVPAVIATVWRSYVPLPRYTLQFWDTNILDFNYGFQFALSIPLMFISVWCVASSRVATVALLTGWCGLFASWCALYFGALRHHGHLFVLFIAACWLAQLAPAPSKESAAFVRNSAQLRSVFLSVILAIQALAGIYASVQEFRVPFSAGRAVARFIREKQLDALTIVGDSEPAMQPIVALLDRPVYYPSRGRFGTYFSWDDRWRVPSSDELIARVAVLQQQSRQDVLLVLGHPLRATPPGCIRLRAFLDSIVVDERYWLYLMPYRARQ